MRPDGYLTTGTSVRTSRARRESGEREPVPGHALCPSLMGRADSTPDGPLDS